MEEIVRMRRVTSPFRTKSRQEAVQWRSRQTFKWILAKQPWKIGNLFILFNHWQSWWRGASCTCYLEKGAEQDIPTAFNKACHSHESPPLPSYHTTLFSPVHVAQVPAGIPLIFGFPVERGSFHSQERACASCHILQAPHNSAKL